MKLGKRKSIISNNKLKEKTKQTKKFPPFSILKEKQRLIANEDY